MFSKKSKLKGQIAKAKRIVYAGEFDLERVLSGLGSPPSNSDKLTSTCIVIEAVANEICLRIEVSTSEVLMMLEGYKQGKKSLSESSLQYKRELIWQKANLALLKAAARFTIEKLAPEFSLRGIVFRAEKEKRGLLSASEYAEFSAMHKKLEKAEADVARELNG